MSTDAAPLRALPPVVGYADFDVLHDDIPRWRALVASFAARYSDAPFTPMEEGTVLVGLLGDELVFKLYPPFLRDHFEFEAAMLPRLHGRLSVPTPRLVDRGEIDGWPFVVMTQLPGAPLTTTWPGLDEAAKCAVLSAIGRVAAEVHALPVDGQRALAPRWADFIERQRAGCRRRQERVGLPPQLLAQLEPFIAGELPGGPDVMLTGEYTPMNLLHGPQGLAGMYDFGDGLIGLAGYDWLGPLCFLAAGSRERVDAYLEGYGAARDRRWRLPALRMLLLHRYSNPRAQIAHPGWQAARSFEEVVELVWP
ncbi:phosphotransferase family protein [Aquabacterium humicola]|uniref:phosphotransferase family protein n=1 Tax=Aquabacterium humicola TaxID=3237377 RepID=UPI002542E04A|nr:phosphotransferase [Rubrivivax pictus]